MILFTQPRYNTALKYLTLFRARNEPDLFAIKVTSVELFIKYHCFASSFYIQCLHMDVCVCTFYIQCLHMDVCVCTFYIQCLHMDVCVCTFYIRCLHFIFKHEPSNFSFIFGSTMNL